jgi:hypothetical protein
VPSRIDRNRRAEAGIISRHPREAVAFVLGGSAIVMICANALFMQPGPHPAPMFTRAKPALAPATLTPAPLSPLPAHFVPVQVERLPPARPVELPPARPAKLAAAEPARPDPIAQLLAPSKRIVAVQRILTAYGYGQIKPTGMLDTPTEDAIRKFETARKMPVTGQLSDPLVRALAAMSGQQID